MSEQMIGAIVAGTLFSGSGLLMMRNEKFARWTLSYGAGRMWVRLLGEERALRLTKRFFGPLVLSMGIIAFLGFFVVANTHSS